MRLVMSAVKKNAAKLLAALCATLGLASCGYHTAGHGDLLPPSLKTIAVPAFANATVRYKLTDRLPEAISRELLTRTRYRVVSNPQAADAVLHGTVITYTSYPTVFDPATGRASAAEIHLTLRVTLQERATGKELFSRPSFEIRGSYEISLQAANYFEESDDALDRVSKMAARQVVTGILDGF
jgi:outer membrane lipopolysaccharide assembly protein LptE/RlpB